MASGVDAAAGTMAPMELAAEICTSSYSFAGTFEEM